MHFSRAVAFAAFTALKWLSIVAAVLFAALAARFGYDAYSLESIIGALVAALGACVCAYILHRLANAIR